MKYFLLSLMALAFVGCTDAQFDKVTSLGSARTIVCYSGGTIIYQGTSTGKIANEVNSDGYLFRDAKTKELVEVSGDCVLKSK